MVRQEVADSMVDEPAHSVEATPAGAVDPGMPVAAGTFKSLAAALQATLNGSLLGWAIHRTGKPAAWIRRDLQTVLAPYRPARRGRSGAARARARK